MIKIVTISGSLFPKSNTSRALKVVEEQLCQDERIEVVRINPGDYQLAFPGSESGGGDAKELQNLVADVTAVILGTPEYHGSFSAILKLVIESLGYPSVLEGKPVALLGVASGAIGAVKSLEHLRSVASHIGCIILPGPVSIAGVHKCFDADGLCICGETRKRLERQADNLIGFIDDHICPKIALEEMVRGDD